MSEEFQILLYYKYTPIEDTQDFLKNQRELCQKLGLKGRIIIAHEGINGTLEGTAENIRIYAKALKDDPRFADIHLKFSAGTGASFPKLSVKVRSEIVSLHLPKEADIDPRTTTGKYLQAEQLHDWIHNKNEEFYIIDMRNYYETKVGHFEGSVLIPQMNNFRDLAEVLPQIEHLKHKKVLTVCTGGVRCEKASGFLVKHGFTDVYQLFGGIVTYMEKYPNEDFKGKLYVFDERIMIGFHTDDEKHEIVGKCDFCGVTSENCINYYLKDGRRVRGIVCENCIAKGFMERRHNDYYVIQDVVPIR